MAKMYRHLLTTAVAFTLLGVPLGSTAAEPLPKQAALRALHGQCRERKRKIDELQRRVRELERKIQAKDKAIKNYRGVKDRNSKIVQRLESK